MVIPSHMRAMSIRPQRELVAVQLAVPTISDDDLLIKTAYAGLNRADLMQLQGTYPAPPDASPLPGLEVSGTVAALGRNVTGWEVGDAVCALLNGGGYAEYVQVPASQALPCPPGVPLDHAASLPEACATACMALADEARLVAGERVLVHGGSSGVGHLLGQIARAWGAEVFATAGGEAKSAFVRSLGVTSIDHRRAPFAEQILAATQGEGVDVIVDILGGPPLATHLKLLRTGGRLVSLAMLEGPQTEPLKIGGLLMKNLRLSGATLRSRTPDQKTLIMQQVRDRIWPHLANGTIRPVIDAVFPLEQAEKALSYLQERLHCGKILLEVGAK